MQFKALEYLEAIYKYKNFTKAAEALFVSQPAISAAIRKLEEEFNVKLIIRTPKKVIFTPEGEAFITKISPILKELREIEWDMLAKSQKQKKTLHLGLSPTAPPDIVHGIYQYFLPSLSENEEVSFDEGGAYYHIAKISNGEVDVAINVIPENISDFSVASIPLYQQEICLLIHENSKLAQYDKIPIQLLSTTPIVSLGASSYLPKRLEMEAAKRNIHLKVTSKHVHQTSYIEEILIGGSSGIINVDKNNIPRALYAHKSLVTRPFQEPMFLTIGILYRKDSQLQPLTKKILEFIQEAAKLSVQKQQIAEKPSKK
ncbi:hydrogen peroxide-inducible protein activator [Anaerotignum neopropionicum]|uniref:Hydrogen peroxide-inducible protein activator n=1 Tax=Anaerotignum neopropionicum TaxID=36847 RepID=A0A136WEX0_9FIRM|nr:LysR family transcriptional regulator [Anaerotignum neopropionicum]KXL53092.1 hydrogen peroxide-inducible protein activator [Anaerotignum neopropionicum]